MQQAEHSAVPVVTWPGTGFSSRVSDPTDLCHLFLDTLPVQGASVTVMAPSGARMSLCSSDALAARIDEIHFELGEGPQWFAADAGTAITISNTDASAHDRWPIFGAAMIGLPVATLSCVPMQMGAVNVGVVSLYQTTPTGLNVAQLRTARAIASAVAPTAIAQAMLVAREDYARESLTSPALRREVHQATGMIVAQLDISATTAYTRLQAHAFATGRTVQSVAHDVVRRQLDFTETSE